MDNTMTISEVREVAKEKIDLISKRIEAARSVLSGSVTPEDGAKVQRWLRYAIAAITAISTAETIREVRTEYNVIIADYDKLVASVKPRAIATTEKDVAASDAKKAAKDPEPPSPDLSSEPSDGLGSPTGKSGTLGTLLLIALGVFAIHKLA